MHRRQLTGNTMLLPLPSAQIAYTATVAASLPPTATDLVEQLSFHLLEFSVLTHIYSCTGAYDNN